jgi:hypothetical protein
MMKRIHQIRGKGYCSAENVPFLGGATICVLLPLTMQNQPVVLGLGGAAERIRKNHARYLAVLQRAAKTVKPEGAFDQPIDIEF